VQGSCGFYFMQWASADVGCQAPRTIIQ
jgi:hypothetical protein